MSEIIPCPCTRDCVKRGPGCHAECRDYLVYEARKREDYARSRHDPGWHSTTPGFERRIREAKRNQASGRRHVR